jgi:phytoene dehydrogenase-like protein
MDIVIIGAGIAGLTAAYRISQYNPHLSCMILEKEAHIGGRIQYESFFGEEMKMGGGILRREDLETQHLLDELGIPYHFSRHDIQYIHKPLDIKDLIVKTKQFYKKNHPPLGITFKEYAIKLWGLPLYKHFLESNMYIDFENSSAYEVLFTNDFNYNTDGFMEGSVEWNKLIEELHKRIPYPIYTNCACTQLHKRTNGYMIDTSRGVSIFARKLIIAVTAKALDSLLPGMGYHYLLESPAIKVYAKADKRSAYILEKYVRVHTIVPGPLHNIMPIHPKKGIYLIAYSDEDKAKMISSISNDTPEHRDQFARLVEQSLHLQKGSIVFEKIHSRYWSNAMHVNHASIHSLSTFLYRLQRPSPFIRVIGEAVNESHGWIGSAIDSVNVITKEWIDQ